MRRPPKPELPMTRTLRVRTGTAFTNGPIGYRASVDAAGVVRVWDSTAGHWTLCHALTDAQRRYIRARAA